jgi:hypothetical protein
LARTAKASATTFSTFAASFSMVVKTEWRLKVIAYLLLFDRRAPIDRLPLEEPRLGVLKMSDLNALPLPAIEVIPAVVVVTLDGRVASVWVFDALEPRSVLAGDVDETVGGLVLPLNSTDLVATSRRRDHSSGVGRGGLWAHVGRLPPPGDECNALLGQAVRRASR